MITSSEKLWAIALTGAFAVVLIVAVSLSLNRGEQILGGGTTDNSFSSGEMSNAATSTGSNLVPVRILDQNGDRRYARIMNDSDTKIYFYFGNFDSGLAASTTVTLTKGMALAAGGSYEINPNNLYLGQIWATSTAASKSIITVEASQ